jgi:O-acetyl-ADP-ribose deacetylase (regulator of RNase III)
MIKVVLVDINAKMIKAWRDAFEENPEVDVVQGSMLDQQVSAWVSPTNSRGAMDGGLDAVIKNHLGAKIEKAVQQEIARLYSGFMPVGHATCVETGRGSPRYLISTPTMSSSSQDISDTLNVALACAAAFQMVHMQNARQGGAIRSVALPGLGANTGKVPVEICADLMWTAYNLFREHEFTTFTEMRAALEEQLGDLGTPGGGSKKATPSHSSAPKAQKAPSASPPPPAKKPDVDFDDHE